MRRPFRLAVAALTAAAVAVPLGATAAHAATPMWGQAGQGPGNTAYNAAESVINASTIAELKARWTAKPSRLQPEMCDAPLAPPVVSGGRAFAADSAGVVAYDAKSGRRLWSNRTAFYDVSPSLAVSGDVVVGYAYTCGSVSDPNGVMVAFDAATGAIKWQTKRDSPFAEVVIDSGVVVASGGSASDTDAVSAYKLTDGTVVWDRSDHLLRRPVSAGGTLLLTHTEEDGAAAVSAATGATLWTTPRNLSVLAANPAGDRFYAVQADTTLVALKVSNGAQVWSVPKLPGEVAADGKRLFITDGLKTVIAYDAARGRKQWSRNLGGYVNRPVRAGGLLYAIVAGKPLAILAPTTGAVAASGAPYKSAKFHVVPVGGRLYTTDGTTLRTYTP